MKTDEAVEILRKHAAVHALNGDWNIADALQTILSERVELLSRLDCMERSNLLSRQIG